MVEVIHKPTQTLRPLCSPVSSEIRSSKMVVTHKTNQKIRLRWALQLDAEMFKQKALSYYSYLDILPIMVIRRRRWYTIKMNRVLQLEAPETWAYILLQHYTSARLRRGRIMTHSPFLCPLRFVPLPTKCTEQDRRSISTQHQLHCRYSEQQQCPQGLKLALWDQHLNLR